MYTAPYRVFAIEDYEAKYYTLLRLAAGQDISCIATVNPSTIVLLADRLAQHTESIIRDVRDGHAVPRLRGPAEHPGVAAPATRRRPRHAPGAGGQRAGGGVLRPGLAWPKLAAIGCWKGGTVGAYLANFDTFFPQRPPVRDLGYYATELRGSVPLSDDGDAGVLAVGTNLLEFHPADDDRAPDGPRACSPSSDLEVGRALLRLRHQRLGAVPLRHERHRRGGRAPRPDPADPVRPEGEGRRLVHRREAVRGPGHRAPSRRRSRRSGAGTTSSRRWPSWSTERRRGWSS